MANASIAMFEITDANFRNHFAEDPNPENFASGFLNANTVIKDTSENNLRDVDMESEGYKSIRISMMERLAEGKDPFDDMYPILLRFLHSDEQKIINGELDLNDARPILVAGGHRLAAALDLARETGDPRYLKMYGRIRHFPDNCSIMQAQIVENITRVQQRDTDMVVLVQRYVAEKQDTDPNFSLDQLAKELKISVPHLKSYLKMSVLDKLTIKDPTGKSQDPVKVLSLVGKKVKDGDEGILISITNGLHLAKVKNLKAQTQEVIDRVVQEAMTKNSTEFAEWVRDFNKAGGKNASVTSRPTRSYKISRAPSHTKMYDAFDDMNEFAEANGLSSEEFDDRNSDAYFMGRMEALREIYEYTQVELVKVEEEGPKSLGL
jgi:hypothetical protein